MTIKMLNEIKASLISKAQTRPDTMYKVTGKDTIELLDIIIELIDDNIKLQLEKTKTKIVYRGKQ
jgi:hypothetical protein